mmetsp:Transcript_15279/g.22430  ORF Transcript_15279/g.22430 Transcript_15279/m.22430 type:complete len:94 (+) Transcript_15279:69-350(+)
MDGVFIPDQSNTRDSKWDSPPGLAVMTRFQFVAAAPTHPLARPTSDNSELLLAQPVKDEVIQHVQRQLELLIKSTASSSSAQCRMHNNKRPDR